LYRARSPPVSPETPELPPDASSGEKLSASAQSAIDVLGALVLFRSQ